MNPTIAGAPIEVILFTFLSLTAIIGAFRVITAKDPFTSALSLLVNFIALGGMYLMADQTFVALAQVMVYAGAVVVLFLFVIAYLGDRRELVGSSDRLPYGKLIGTLGALAFGGLLVGVIVTAQFPETLETTKTAAGYAFGSPHAIGEIFLTKYILEFEGTSIVLLVAAIGGVVLGLTGRARLQRMRKLMHTRSADQQRRLHEQDSARIRAERDGKELS